STLGGVCVWDAASGKERVTLREPRTPDTPFEILGSITWSPDGKQLATASFSSPRVGIRIWEVATARVILTLRDGFWDTVSWSPDGKHLAGTGRIRGGNESIIRVWDLSIGKEKIDLKHRVVAESLPSPRGVPVAWSPDGKQIARGGNPGTVWDAIT